MEELCNPSGRSSSGCAKHGRGTLRGVVKRRRLPWKSWDSHVCSPGLFLVVFFPPFAWAVAFGNECAHLAFCPLFGVLSSIVLLLLVGMNVHTHSPLYPPPAVEVKESSIPGAGLGVFVSQGVMHPGTLAGRIVGPFTVGDVCIHCLCLCTHSCSCWCHDPPCLCAEPPPSLPQHVSFLVFFDANPLSPLGFPHTLRSCAIQSFWCFFSSTHAWLLFLTRTVPWDPVSVF